MFSLFFLFGLLLAATHIEGAATTTNLRRGEAALSNEVEEEEEDRRLTTTEAPTYVTMPPAEFEFKVFMNIVNFIDERVGDCMLLTENFNTNSITAPGLSFTSTVGLIGTFRFNDLLRGNRQTTWFFAYGATAFGAFWDLAGPGGRGTGLAVSVYLVVDNVFVGEIPRSLRNDFWGIVANQPFYSIRLVEGTDPRGRQETYTMDNLVFEPATCH